MDDAQIGSVFRAVRLRLGLTQGQVAAKAGSSRPIVSLIERGGVEQTSLRAARAVARSLGISLSMDTRWRGAAMAKLLDERHAALVRATAAILRGLGFEVHVEYPFSIWGERGSIDILAWHPILRVVVAIEVKTRLVDLQDLFSTTDRKRRLVATICRQEGWEPVAAGSVLVLPEEGWARKGVRRFAPLFDAAFPARTVEVRRWLQRPVGDLRGIWFLADDRHGSTRQELDRQMPVRRTATGERTPDSCPDRPN
jgi:transcriptional regulator with XRE-family HTH domain